MKPFVFILSLILLLGCSTKKEQTTPIELGNWEFQYQEKWYPATVPGVIHTDLLSNQLIEDPFYENNELKLQWIEKENWKYRNVFTITPDQLNDKHIELVFEGLDTYAEVLLNGESIMLSDNMFRSWIADVKQYLKVGGNTLEVNFTSPINYNQEIYNKYPWKLPSGSETEEPRVGSFTRKAAYHFGWDWAPRFVSSGIWRPVKIKTWDIAKIKDVHCYTANLSENEATIKVEIKIEADVKEAEYTTVQIQINDTTLLYGLKDGLNEIAYSFKVINPKLWWCNGMGEAHLYNLNVGLTTNDRTIDTRNIKYGIRTIELINEPDSIGTNFYFKLNGKPVFMKGANYIPQDVFLPRVSDEQYNTLLTAVKDVNMNMLRVWGGGIYENDVFYSLCDEYGILVWQDFMFAGSLYPHHQKFLTTVKEEIKENVIRLRNHPSIALWCGNNEIEVAWNNWGWQQQFDYTESTTFKVWKDYTSLFHRTIPEIVNELDPKRNYTPTSPLSNWGTPENFNHSSMHYWGVWHGREPFENFEKNVGRFMVEYGFQSFPEMETIQTFASDSSQYLESATMLNRQKSYIGNGLITKHIEQYYGNPKSFKGFVALSQEVQAKGMQMAIRAHMNNQPHCMGSLFWQLNDCWPGPSWSVIDYYGRKKKAYAIVKTEFGK